MGKLIIKSPAFDDFGLMPNKHTGFFEDVSPELDLENISDKAVSMAIILDDLDIPFIKEYNHWVAWNIPVTKVIKEGFPKGNLEDGTIQGIGYGKHQYRGPKQPFFIRKFHRYRFTIYILDTKIDLDSNAKKRDLKEKMKGHILQEASITANHRRKMKNND